MMKKIPKALLIGATVLLFGLLASCGGRRVQLGWVASTLPGHFWAEYTLFTGTERRPVRAEAGEKLVLRYDTEVGSGTLSIKIEDPDRDLLWDVSLEQDAGDTASVRMGQDGRYAIVVQGDGTSGSFDLSWEVDQARGGGR
jgi:hypothetical protein